MKTSVFFAAIALISSSITNAAELCERYSAELASMAAAQQAASQAVAVSSSVQSGIEKMLAAQRFNTDRLKSLVGICGWPRRSVEGAAASAHAFSIARLSTHDLPFQRVAVSLLESSVKANEASAQQYAFLSDQIAVAEGRPQLFGTQLVNVGACEFSYARLDDRGLVEARRSKLGLQSLDEFIGMVNGTATSSGCLAPVPQ